MPERWWTQEIAKDNGRGGDTSSRALRPTGRWGKAGMPAGMVDRKKWGDESRTIRCCLLSCVDCEIAGTRGAMVLLPRRGPQEKLRRVSTQSLIRSYR